MNRADLVARGLVLALAVGAAGTVLSLRESSAGAGPARATSGAPASAAPPAAAAASARSGDIGVAIRLVDELGHAVYDAPELAREEATVKYWRRMRSPYAGPGGTLGRVVQDVALVRSGGDRSQREQAGVGRSWIPDPKVWNMNEGSFDQREAILAPPPSTIRFHVQLPQGAVLETAPAMIRTLLLPVAFEVWIATSAHDRQLVASRVVEPKGPRGWVDWHVDLSRWGGKNVDLELITRLITPPPPPVLPGDKPQRHQRLVPPPAYWGTPVVLAPGATDVPFNVVFIVVDAMRGDAIPATHDSATDQQKENAKFAPEDAWLPKMPGLAPNLDALAKQGVIFTNAHSGAMWTRPGTVAMLAGTRSGELGLSPLGLVPPLSEVQRFYAAHPPFLPLLLRPRGVTTRAFVNNFYMIGYAGAGVDMGFEGVIDHRYNTEDTREILADTLKWLHANKDRRFALFVNFNSPHSPYSPPKEDLEAVPAPPAGPKDRMVRQYLGEIHKDDHAIGELVRQLDELGLGSKTFIVVTADHGETLGEEHDSTTIQLEGDGWVSGRFHHLSTIWDETTRVPIIMRYPPGIPAGTRVGIPVQNTDILPTILDLAGIDAASPMDGRTLVPLIRGTSKQEVPVIVEGRATRSILMGKWRLIVRDPIAQVQRVRGKRVVHQFELYDLETDPGERNDVVAHHPDVVAKLHAELLSHLGRMKREGSGTGATLPTIRLRFAGGGARLHVTGTLKTRPLSGGARATLRANAVGLPGTTVSIVDGIAHLDFVTLPDRAVGIDVQIEPPTTDLDWDIYADDKPWPVDRVYAGGYGLAAADLAKGVVGEQGRALATADRQPIIDPEHDQGLFITRDLVAHEVEIDQGGAAAQETMDLMRAWGYVRDKNDK